MSAGVPLPPQEHVDSNALPTPSQLSEAGALAIYDQHGQKFHFGHLVHLSTSESLSTLGEDSRVPELLTTNTDAEGAGAVAVAVAVAVAGGGGAGGSEGGSGGGKVAVVFIRHFICGACQAYVQNLARVPQEAIQRAGATLVVIGCGEWEVLQTYREITGFQGPIYADASRALYHALGMTDENLKKTPSGEPKPSYLDGGSGTLGSIWKALTHPKLIGKSGNYSQNGGEFVFEEGKCVFASRMRHTEDHVPVVKLMQLLGVEYSEGEVNGGEEQKPRL